jgi:hypothetical protein
MRQRAAGQKPSDEATASVARRLASANADEQLAALAEVEKQSPAGQFAVIGSVATLAENAAESRVREAAKQLIARLIFAGGSKRPGLPKADVEAIQQLSKLQKTNVAKVTVAGDGTLTIARAWQRLEYARHQARGSGAIKRGRFRSPIRLAGRQIQVAIAPALL